MSKNFETKNVSVCNFFSYFLTSIKIDRFVMQYFGLFLGKNYWHNNGILVQIPQDLQRY